MTIYGHLLRLMCIALLITAIVFSGLSLNEAYKADSMSKIDLPCYDGRMNEIKGVTCEGYDTSKQNYYLTWTVVFGLLFVITSAFYSVFKEDYLI